MDRTDQDSNFARERSAKIMFYPIELNQMSQIIRAACLSVLMLSTVSAFATRVDNFVLLDQKGDAHELYYHQAAPSVTIMVQATQCADSAADIALFQQLAASKKASGHQFYLLNPSLQDDRVELAAWAETNEISTPILDDETQLISESLNARKAGEVIVLDPQTWKVTYRGGIAQANDAVDAVGTKNEIASAEYAGCPIAFPQAAKEQHAQISYGQDVAPILQDKCVVCHTEGGLGPWAMSDYNMVLGFSPMIREVLRTKRMPPWHADPHIGVWKNDIGLTAAEAQTIVHWIENGAPRGAGSDPLAETKFAQVDWPLGEPDLILDIPEYTVPASGVVDYQFPTVANPLDTGVWIKAASVKPGDREVVHHILAGTIDADTTDEQRDRLEFDNYLIGYAPGNESHTFPLDTGVYVAPGGEFLFQLHYTPVGREALDQSKIGLYFHREKPKNFYRQDVVVDPTISIPPNEARHKQVAYYEFDKPALLHDLVPHAHYRGVASKFELELADGTRETVLSVPNYDFNWQRTYEFVEPKQIAAGARLIHTTWYDNSAANSRNPDPEREVPWGLQSWDEMLYGAFSYTYVDETTEAPIHDDAFANSSKFVGFLDKDLDGKVSWRELPKQFKKRLVQGFSAVDKDGDGGLNIAEMQVLTQRMREGREREQAEKEPATGAR
ncbi:MAG: redoxin domain-containing protein [Pseudomonadales bacterium]|nr:redoxin domain-containing protein [Pseudomonadales bacterium]